MIIKIFCDGGARGNPGPAAAAFVVYEVPSSLGSAGLASPKPSYDEAKAGNLREKHGKYLGVATNNVAEYTAVIEALEWLRSKIQDTSGGIQVRKQEKREERLEAHFFLDSNLVVNQLNGLFKVKNGRLRELLFKVREGEQALSPIKIVYSYIPREENRLADQVVNETLDKQMWKWVSSRWW